MSYKVIFCGTPDFAVPALTTLISDPDYQVDLVLTQPDRPAGRGKKLRPSPIKQVAIENGIEVWTPESARAQDLLEKLQERGADLAVVVAYGQILPKAFLEMFPNGCFNIHASLLPRWRGAAPIQRAIMEGDKDSGVSLQKIVPKLDAGDVIGEKKISIADEMGSLELYQSLSVLGGDLLTLDLKQFLDGQVTPQIQDESQVTYAKKIEKAEGQIDWSQSAVKIHNQVRGLNMGGPFAMASFRGKQLKIRKSKVSDHSGEAGKIIQVEKDSLTVGCGKGALELIEVQPESKAKMAAGDFIRGYQPKEGESFD